MSICESLSSLLIDTGFIFLSSLTLSAYLRVLSVCSLHDNPGETLAIMTVLQFPMNESFSTCVSLLPLNGVCFLSISIALIHSFKASKDLLISAPSIRVLFILLYRVGPALRTCQIDE